VLIDEHWLSITHLAHQSVEANTVLMREALRRRQVKLTNLTALFRTLIRYRGLGNSLEEIAVNLVQTWLLNFDLLLEVDWKQLAG